MDAYGTVELTKEDAEIIRNSLNEKGAVIFPISRNKIDCYIVTLVQNFTKLGVMPFGGSPSGRILVSVLGRGHAHFSSEPTHEGYFSEKLNLDKEGGEVMSELWALLWG